MSFPTQEQLVKYAELIVRVGLNLRKGQRLLINNLTTRGAPLPSCTRPTIAGRSPRSAMA